MLRGQHPDRGHVPFAWYVTGVTHSSAAWPWGGGCQVGGLPDGKTDEEAAETSLVVCASVQRAWVRSLVRELRPHMLHMAKNCFKEELAVQLRRKVSFQCKKAVLDHHFSVCHLPGNKVLCLSTQIRIELALL